MAPRNLTARKAALTTPDPATYPEVRLVIRSGVAEAFTGNALVWTAHLDGFARTGRTVTMTLLDGSTASAVLPKGCNCGG